MRIHIATGAAAASLMLGLTAFAQQDITIQQPVFNFSTVNTTVTAPDGGTALLGGINRAAEGSNYRGVPMLSKIPGVNRLFQNRGIGREMSASNMSITPRIIILEEEEFRQTGMSPETLARMEASGTAGGQFGGQFGGIAPPQDDPIARRAAFLTSNIARHELDSPLYERAEDLPGVNQVRAENAMAAAQRTSEASEYFAKASKAEQEGKTAIAKIYYKMAERRAQGDLLQQIAARLEALESPSPANQFATQ